MLLSPCGQSENIEQWIGFIPLFLEDTGLLAAFTYPSHIVSYAPGDALSCRLPVSSMILGIDSCLLHQRDKVVEQLRGFVRAGARFRVALKTECRFIGTVDPLQGAIK